MKMLHSVSLNTPVRMIITIGLMVLVGEFSIMLLKDGVFNPVFKDKISKVFWQFIDPIVLTTIVSPALYALIFRPLRNQKIELKWREKYADNIIASLPVGLVVVSNTLRVRSVNRFFREMFSMEGGEDVSGHELEAILPLSNLRQQVQTVLSSRTALRGIDTALGEKWLRLIITVIQHAEEDELLLVVEDITELKAQAAHIEQLAFYDLLTGLPNRTLFMERLQQSLANAKSSEQPLAIMFVDLNRFKEVNDTHGHLIGDQVLVEIARRFSSALHQGEMLARLGGDEFVVIAMGASRSAAATIAVRLLATLDERVVVNNHAFNLGASIGITFLCADVGEEPYQLLKQADIAMYRAKEMSRGYCFYNPELGADMNWRLELVQRLTFAMQSQQLQLHYQPKVDLQTGQFSGAEVLLRWHDPEWGWISPEIFIPIAEERGMIISLGEWVLSEACRQLKEWEMAGVDFSGRLAINVAAQQIEMEGFAEHVRAIVQGAGLVPSSIELELTESGMMQAPESAIKVMQALGEAGFTISIDDFGTGHSSLSYLKRFAVDKLKIDISFVQDMLTDTSSHQIVAAVIAMAKSLGMETVAEGVEEAAQAEVLFSLGCNEAQGYYFGHPEPAEVFAQKWLNKAVFQRDLA